ncbi:MAG TPA: glycosyltransferase, partial [Bryobacteraceae bacterium]|nr:glycosyltransferase [Bryobacteraceae bacterium]
MTLKIVCDACLALATFPFIYYLITLYSSWRFFNRGRRARARVNGDFLPPISNLKPIRGLDPDAYENFATLCRQDYPDYELLFCVSSMDDPAVPILEQLARDFPQRSIRIVVGSNRTGANDKVAKLARLTGEARYEHLVINDSDVRVGPDYFRTIIAPLQNPNVGCVTCLYVSAETKTFAEKLHWVGMISDFFASILTARQLDGVKFALGTTIATTRTRLAEFGGYDAIVNRPADDLLIGRLIAEQGREVELLPYCVETVSDYGSIPELLHKRLRWIVVMRHLRPGGHFGLIFTQGLAWSLIAIAAHPTALIAAIYLGTYFLLRVAMTWTIGAWGLNQRALWKKMP